MSSTPTRNLAAYGPNLILLFSTLIIGRLPTEYSTVATVAIGLLVAGFVALTGLGGASTEERRAATGKPSQLTRGTASENAEDDDALFEELVSNWRQERGIGSSIDKIVMCYSYQRIIAMGERAIPLILCQLENEGDEPDHWFWALRVLTGENPISDSERGDLRAMSRRWLQWGRTHYAW